MGVEIEVVCRRGYIEGHHMETVESVDLGVFVVPAVPRVGELIEVWDGWAGERVAEVWHCLSRKIITVEIGPDYSGEYRSEVVRRAALEGE